MNHSNNISDETKNISIKSILQSIQKYKYSILIITLLSISYSLKSAYFAQNSYSTSSTLLFTQTQKTSDVITQAFQNTESELGVEKSIINSYSIAEGALEYLNLGTRYYLTKNYKTQELYQDSPFIVTHTTLSQKAKSLTFHLLPVDDKTFALEIRPTLKQKIIDKLRSFIQDIPSEKRAINYKQIFKYNEVVETPWINFTITKIHALKNLPYSFTVHENKDMVGMVKSAINVHIQSESILNITSRDTVPKRAYDILQAVIHTYLEQSLQEKMKSDKKTLQFIDTQLDNIKQSLQDSAHDLATYKKKNIVLDIGSQATNTATAITELENNLNELSNHELILQNILSYLLNYNDTDGIDIESATEASPTISAEVAKIQNLESRRDALLVDFTELHPDVIKILGRLETSKLALIKSIRSTLVYIEKKKALLTKKIKDTSKAFKSLPEKEQALAKLTRNFSTNDNIYSYLLERRAETAIISSATVPIARVLDKASVPFFPTGPKRNMMIITGLMLGLFFGIAQALFREFLNKTIKNLEEIENLSDLDIYGVIPLKSTKTIENQNFYESLRVLRTNLEFIPSDNISKLITTTSSVPSEGKTTVICELAKVIALTHKKVILVDLDMRRAKVHDNFDLDNREGISNVLKGKVPLKNVVQHLTEEELDIITAGPVPHNPSELIMTDMLTDIIKTLRKYYDYILIDTPPIGLVTDAMIVMKESDLNLFVVRSEYSNKAFIPNINQFVQKHSLKNSGIVFNAVKNNTTTGYGNGYGYGYGYSK